MASHQGESTAQANMGALIQARQVNSGGNDLTRHPNPVSDAMPERLVKYNENCLSAYNGNGSCQPILMPRLRPPPTISFMPLSGQDLALDYYANYLATPAAPLDNLIPFQNRMYATGASPAQPSFATSISTYPLSTHAHAATQSKFQPTRNTVDLHHVTSLSVDSDSTFLDPVHNFIRANCIELFVVTEEYMLASGTGRGARPSKIGQVGLRCIYCKGMSHQGSARQAVCFPSKIETIFESVRNFQRFHLDKCVFVPDQVRAKHKLLTKQDDPRRKAVKYVKAYYAQAASELGLVDTPNGLVFGSAPNRTGMPSKRLGALIQAVESPSSEASFWKAHSSGKDEAMQMKKFEHVASHKTRDVIINARKNPSPFAYPQDFPKVADIDFLLFHQVIPCQPHSVMENKGLESAQSNSLPGLCCKHCAHVHSRDAHPKGIYFPSSLSALSDSSFSQTLLSHMMRCPYVPQEIKDAFDELKQLAINHGITTRRGSKKRYFQKIWARMEKYHD